MFSIYEPPDGYCCGWWQVSASQSVTVRRLAVLIISCVHMLHI